MTSILSHCRRETQAAKQASENCSFPKMRKQHMLSPLLLLLHEEHHRNDCWWTQRSLGLMCISSFNWFSLCTYFAFLTMKYMGGKWVKNGSSLSLLERQIASFNHMLCPWFCTHVCTHARAHARTHAVTQRERGIFQLYHPIIQPPK